MAQESDQAVISRCRRGSQSAFETVFERYQRRTYLLALQMVGNREDALDASQASLAKAFMNLDKFDSRRSFAPWLFRIVRNQCIDLLRKRRGKKTQPLDEAGGAACSTDDPVAAMQRDEMKKQIWSAMGKLSAREREVLILREFHDMRYKEIAAVLEVPIGTVMSRLSAARKNLRGLMLEYLR